MQRRVRELTDGIGNPELDRFSSLGRPLGLCSCCCLVIVVLNRDNRGCGVPAYGRNRHDCSLGSK
jgi:hypothetical protein